MILSHRYKFIFIKTTKTAGTSIELALSKFCAPDDIITPLNSEDEKLRSDLGYPGPSNYQPKWYSFGAKGLRRKLRGKPLPEFYNHISAREIRPLVPQRVWDSYFKFCVERNPWDRMISGYYFEHQKEPRPSFGDFVEAGGHRPLKRRGSGNYTIDGEVAVDRIVYFERLTEELEEIRLHLGLPEPLELPRAKGQFRVDKRPYQEVIDESCRDRIAQEFSFEIDRFGYRF